MHDESTPRATPEHRTPQRVPGHPGIFKKGSRYQVRVRARGRQAARSFRTLSEARAHKARVVAGDTQPASREPFRTFALRWIDTYTGRTARGVSDDTRNSYRDSLTRLAIPYFQAARLDQIDAPMLRDYIEVLRRRGLAASSVRRNFAPIRALLADAHRDGHIVRNPALGMRVIVPGEQTSKPKRLTPEQTQQLLAAMPVAHADLAYFLAATGCRISEALAATWRDVGPDANGRPCLTVAKSKTPSGERVLPLSPHTVRRLTRRRAEADFPGDEHPIFPTDDGTSLDPHNYRRRVFRPAAKRAGVEWATPHTLRHGLASLMADEGYSAAQIAAHLGHADGGVLALRTYIHTAPLDAPDFVDEAFSGAG